MTDDLIEKVAKAIYETGDSYTTWDDVCRLSALDGYLVAKGKRSGAINAARAALAAIEGAGWAVVPVEPTDEMYDAAIASGFEGERRHLVKDYAAMISARPRLGDGK